MKVFIRQITLIILISLFLLNMNLAAEDVEKVKIKTEHGDFKVVLYPTKAPKTVANFLKYVKEKKFENGSFY